MAKAMPPPLLVLLPPPRTTGSARSRGDWRRLVGGMERAVATVRVLSVANRIDACCAVAAVRVHRYIARFLCAQRQVSQTLLLMANSGSVARIRMHPSWERRHSGQGRCPELKHADTANNRGVGE